MKYLTAPGEGEHVHLRLGLDGESATRACLEFGFHASDHTLAIRSCRALSLEVDA